MQKVIGITAYLFLLVFISSTFSFAAAEKNQPATRDDISKIFDLYSNIRNFESTDESDSLEYYVNKAYLFCQKLDLNSVESEEAERAIAHIYFSYGEIKYFSNDVFESINGYEKAIKYFKKYDIKDKYADATTSLATNYSKVGQEPKSLKLMHQATSMFIDLKDSAGIMVGYRSIGLLYKRQRDNIRALEYLNKALQVSKNIDDVDATIHLLIAMAAMHRRTEELEKAKGLYLEALELSEFAIHDLTRSSVYSNFGEYYKNTGNLEQAKLLFDKAYEIIEKNDSDYKMSFILLNYADYNFLKEDYQEAIKYGEKALKLCEEIKNRRGEFITLNILIKIYEKIDNPNQLAKYQKRVIESLFEQKDQLNQQINDLEIVRFKLDKQNIIAENEKIQQQLEQEQEEETRLYFYLLISSLFILLLTFSLVIYFRLRNTKEHNKIISKQNEERKLLLQEVHHRVKNNFQIVSSMLRLQSYNFNDTELSRNFEEAVSRINAMAIIHNVIYRQEKFKDIDSKSYLEKLVKNLSKSGDNRIMISIDSEAIPFKIETLINLGIALNELITNSFKHAFNSEITQPKIIISLRSLNAKTFELIYKDNGVGINKDAYKSSFGMELIDTIISNYDGEMSFVTENEWNTSIKIIFKEF